MAEINSTWLPEQTSFGWLENRGDSWNFTTERESGGGSERGGVGGGVVISATNIVIGTVLYLIVLMTITGNAMVLLAVARNKRLQTVFNMYIVNLAVTDILVALLAMSFYTTENLLGYWPFGEFMCGVWIFFDYGMTFASVFTLLAISVDRFWAVKWSMHYRTNKTKKKTFFGIGLTWACMLLLWLPPCITDRLANSRPGECIWEPSDNKEFVIVVAVIGHHGSCFIILFCYVSVLVLLRHRAKVGISSARNTDAVTATELSSFQQPTKGSARLVPENSSTVDHPTEAQDRGSDTTGLPQRDATTVESGAAQSAVINGFQRDFDKHHNTLSVLTKSERLPSDDSMTKETSLCNVSTEGRVDAGSQLAKTNDNDAEKTEAKTDDSAEKLHSTIQQDSQRVSRFPRSPKSHGVSFKQNEASEVTSTEQASKVWGKKPNKKEGRGKDRLGSKEMKAFVTLSYIVISYMVCWVPFHIVFDVSAVRPELVPDLVYTVTFWMTYLNSTINPILYNFSSRDFRNAFRDMCKR